MQEAEPNETLGRGLANPRLSDLFDLVIRQDQVPFVIPHVREDLPLALDPFLLWQSERADYQDLHQQLVGFADFVCNEAAAGRIARAVTTLGEVEELPEIGLGYSVGSKDGTAIGPQLANRSAQTIRAVPQLVDAGFSHIEIIALLVPKVAEDRISDITASVLLKWLAEFTQQQCEQHGVPTRAANFSSAWDADSSQWRPLRTRLPWNPKDERPILLAPLDLLRHLPWINYDNYYESAYAPLVLPPNARRRVAKEAVLEYNRTNFRTVEQYIQSRENEGLAACKPDPLFKPLALDTIKKKLAQLRQLPTGRQDGVDKKYEDLAFSLLSSLLYPELDLADSQVRTVSGAHIRDVIFHNDGKTEFLADLRQRHSARQIVVELKNVASLEPENVNQLYRYLDDSEMGRVGFILTRRPAPPAVVRNTVDLHSSKRFYVICLSDVDLDLMVQLADSERRPVDALRKCYVEFARKLPS